MRAIVRQALAVVFGCMLGLGAGLGPGDPPAGPGVSGTAAFLMTIMPSMPEALAQTPAKQRKKREAKRKAALEREEKAREKRLVGKRVKELPIGCPYDLEGSTEAGSDVYLCGGMRYQAVKEEGFEGYEVHPVNMDRGAINAARERRRAAAKKKAEAARKKRDANRRDELPPGCPYDSVASIAQSADIYSCGGVSYRPYKEDGKSGFEIVPPSAPAGGAANPPASTGGGGSTY